MTEYWIVIPYDRPGGYGHEQIPVIADATFKHSITQTRYIIIKSTD